MEDSRKQTLSSVDSKVKKSSFDDDFGKEFFGSWKSLSVAEDDAMEFSFDTVSTDKKKAFKFDKLDMDFNLDGDFNNLRSFKMDMPDIDFSSPSKKTVKPKESSEGESSDGQGKRECFNGQGKLECFNSFDFNELDFDLDSTLTKGKASSAKKSDVKHDGTARIEQEGSKLNLAASNEAFDIYKTDNLPASDNATTSTVEITVDDTPGTVDASNDKFSSKADIIEDLVLTHEAQTSPQNTFSVNPRDTDQQIYMVEKAKSTEPITPVTTQVISALSFDRNDSNQATESDFEDDASAPKAYSKSVEKHNDRKFDNLGSDDDNLKLKNPVSSHRNESGSNMAETEKADSENHVESMIGNLQMQDDLDGKGTSAATLSQTRSQSHAIKDIQKPSLMLLAPLRCEHVADKVIRIEENEPENASSKIFPSSNVSKPQLCQPSSVGVEVLSAVNKGLDNSYPAEEKTDDTCVNEPEVVLSKILQSSIKSEPRLCQPSSVGLHDFSAANSGLANSYPSSEKREGMCINKPGVCSSKGLQSSIETKSQPCQPSSVGVQVSSGVNKGLAASYSGDGKRECIHVNEAETQRKMTGKVKSLTMELTKRETDFPGCKTNDKGLCNLREGFNGDRIKNVSKLDTTLRHPNKEATKADSSLLRSGINNKDLSNFGGKANPTSSTDEATKSDTQKIVDSTNVVSNVISTRNLNVGSSEGLKSGRRTTDLSSLKISRNMGVRKDHPDVMVRRDISSLRNSEKVSEVQGSTASKIVHPVERITPPITSLKRKTYEESNSNQVLLHPQKRLSQSPVQSRNLKELLERTVEVQCNQPEKSPTTMIHNQTASGLDMQNKKEHIFFTMESDQNVEKAEEYAKELEDMCNMLRKKHEEAKELLVRAIVNNNHLLMLNHPIFDAKRVKKFAANLVSSCS